MNDGDALLATIREYRRIHPWTHPHPIRSLHQIGMEGGGGMSTEDAFQAALDANPDDHVCRLAFADWLEEQGDPRAAEYRALGMLGVRPYKLSWAEFWWWDYDLGRHGWSPYLWEFFRSRREAEDAAALAYAEIEVLV